MLTQEPPLIKIQVLNEFEKHMCIFNMYLRSQLHVPVVCTAVCILYKHMSFVNLRI